MRVILKLTRGHAISFVHGIVFINNEANVIEVPRTGVLCLGKGSSTQPQTKIKYPYALMHDCLPLARIDPLSLFASNETAKQKRIILMYSFSVIFLITMKSFLAYLKSANYISEIYGLNFSS